ncbi:MAG TPA: MoaD/ThiS family protein [Anaerolineales bacterium]|nr:MoaD/ThiS family protein [Anaerolineales bacterium]
MIRVILPAHLQRLANVHREAEVQVAGPVTQRSILDALETKYPMLRGTIRDQVTHERRAFIRFFACGEDISFVAADTRLAPAIAMGTEPFRIVGAMAGG